MKPVNGFTLMEMIIVMVILGVIATGVTSFIRFGTLIFIDVSERDELLSSSRFVLERLNRELRTAVPNSVRIRLNSGVQCIEFLPATTSTFYDELPVVPDSGNNITAIAPSNYPANFAQLNMAYALVYPLSPPDVYDTANNKRFEIQDVADLAPGDPKPPVAITLENTVSFAQHSPARRLYITAQPVSYCVRAGSIFRHAAYGYYNEQSIAVADLGTGVLMAEHVINTIEASNSAEQPFELIPASLVRNAYVNLLLRFELNDEKVEFSNEVHIPNAP